eukprot:jgi/Tetstr1/442780/TSEL_030865.t2
MAGVDNSGRRALSVVSDSGPGESSCGYCGSADGSASHGMWAFRLGEAEYGALLDRGWRRAGCWLYKPDLGASCCQQYTIRLDATAHVASKGQRRLLRRLRTWLESGDGGGRDEPMDAPREAETSESEPPAGQGGRTAQAAADALAAACDAALSELPAGSLPPALPQPLPPLRAHAQAGAGPAPAPPALAAALAAALNGALAAGHTGLAAAGLQRAEPSGGHVNFHVAPGAEGGPPPGPGGAAGPQGSAAKRVRTSLGKRAAAPAGPTPAASPADGPPDLGLRGPSDWPMRFLGAAPGGRALTLQMARAAFDEEEFALYKKYQTTQHNDAPEVRCAAGREPAHAWEGWAACPGQGVPPSVRVPDPANMNLHVLARVCCSAHRASFARNPRETSSVCAVWDVRPSSYRRFLVDNPFPRRPAEGSSSGEGAPPCGYGAFHLQYRLDGRLIAVSVVDVLPGCLSSKYFIWDPDMAELSLGKFSALFEIAWVQAMQKVAPRLRYYYMGFYIHNCAKMRYKAEYAPSDLLCPRRYAWMVVLSDVLLRARGADGAKSGEEDADDGRGSSPTAAALSRLERSSNSQESYSLEEARGVLLLEGGELSRVDMVGTALAERILGGVHKWINAVGAPAQHMVYALPRLGLF